MESLDVEVGRIGHIRTVIKRQELAGVQYNEFGAPLS